MNCLECPCAQCAMAKDELKYWQGCAQKAEERAFDLRKELEQLKRSIAVFGAGEAAPSSSQTFDAAAYIEHPLLRKP